MTIWVLRVRNDKRPQSTGTERDATEKDARFLGPLANGDNHFLGPVVDQLSVQTSRGSGQRDTPSARSIAGNTKRTWHMLAWPGRTTQRYFVPPMPCHVGSSFSSAKNDFL